MMKTYRQGLNNIWQFALPAFSGILLGILFYSPSLWFLVFFALVPLLLYLEIYSFTLKKVFIGVGTAIIVMNFIALTTLWPSARFIEYWREDIFFQAPLWLKSPLAINLEFSFFLIFLTAWFSIPHLAILGGGYALWQSRGRPLSHQPMLTFLLVPALWALSEFGRSFISGGSTFGHIGYRVIDFLPLAITSRIWGIYGLSFLVVLINQVLARIFRKSSATHAALIGLVIFLIIGAGFFWSENERQKGWQGQALKVVLVQGGAANESLLEIPRPLPFDYEMLLKGIDQGADLILLPNTIGEPIFSARDSRDSPERSAYFTDFLKEKGSQLILVGHDLIESGRRYNAMIALGQDGAEDVYRKRALFPFGEYFPVLEILFPQAFLSVKRYFPAPNENSILKTSLGKLGVTICQEVYIPSMFTSDLRAGAELLLNGGSEWQFGRYVQEEGLRIARMRALESSRFFARAMKEGTSAVINPLGQVIVRPKKNLDIGTLEAEVKLLQTKTLYSRYGDGAVLLFLFMSIALPFYCCGRSQDDD